LELINEVFAMNEKKIVYVVVGQRGAGKSTYCKQLIDAYPQLLYFSRDDLLVKLFGKTDLDPDSGGCEYVMKALNGAIREKLSMTGGIQILLDVWTSTKEERSQTIERMRMWGADKVVALYLVTPLELVKIWFWKKPGIAKISEMKTHPGEGLLFFSSSAPANDYEIFHNKLCKEIDFECFDQVVRVHPLDPLIIL
jgi:GTPase SAR1 family protein